MVRVNFQQCGYFTYRCLLLAPTMQPPRQSTATTALVVIAMLLLLSSVEPRGALQIPDRSPQLRPVASECVCDWLRDATGLDCGDRSWICNAPLGSTELSSSSMAMTTSAVVAVD